MEDPSKFFYVGQVVQCRVISTDYGKLRLSLRVSAFLNISSALLENLSLCDDDVVYVILGSVSCANGEIFWNRNSVCTSSDHVMCKTHVQLLRVDRDENLLLLSDDNEN